ncbi:MHYT domain-containing protein [Aminobacter sp. AP02]|uniref:MHYT domain-containing protein n=1 Tax=Aminobacter sp. AP02 TaxID=2135737 RepID=UPI000D6C948D|nr:MHYT domain-containing protein [Aminobacter sp. AP02]
MFAGHNPYLVALSIVVAVLGGYTGFGLAARVRSASGASRRLLLAGAAGFLAVGIWTMHFIGMMAAPIHADVDYLVLPTIVSFLICALVVGVSLFFISFGKPSNARVMASALLLGGGIVSMHYVGIHGLAGAFTMHHDHAMVVLAILISVGAAYGGLRIFLARHGGLRLALSAAAFGLAVSGMHYTAMYGMHFQSMHAPTHVVDGLAASPQVLALVVSLLCFILAGGFLLFLVPEPRRRRLPRDSATADEEMLEPVSATDLLVDGAFASWTDNIVHQRQNFSAAPLGGVGQPRAMLVSHIPVEGADGTYFIDVSVVRGVRAYAHYTLAHDGAREHMSAWSISEAEARLDPSRFMRVHRSHIIAIQHISVVRKAGDGAIVELAGPMPHKVPVSRAKTAELRSRLGLGRHKPQPY